MDNKPYKFNESFNKTYNDYINQISKTDQSFIKDKLGIIVENNKLELNVFDNKYYISETSIINKEGEKPSLEICVILSKYILLCKDDVKEDKNWSSFRDFKDSGPLTVFFSNSVEGAIAEHFSGDPKQLEQASKNINGYDPDIELSYEVVVQFDLLPKISLLLLFNDADDEFPAHCSVLFEKHAENYLDAESLAIAGSVLVSKLKKK